MQAGKQESALSVFIRIRWRGASGKTTDKSRCISCMRCLSLCPEQARTVSGLMVGIASMAIKKACSSEKPNELYL